MAIYAKPSGAYGLSSLEAKDNILYAYHYLADKGYSEAAIAGILANAFWESGLNPWRWEGDSVNYSKGYGFFQFTPASGYINNMRSIPGYAPNLSSTQKTSDSNTSDLTAQLNVMSDDKLAKWISLCWREGGVYSSWDAEKANNGVHWQLRRELLNKWAYTGANNLTLEQFKKITDIRHSTFAFFACYEGPREISDVEKRFATANTIYDIIHGSPPTPEKQKKMKLMFYLRRRYYG